MTSHDLTEETNAFRRYLDMPLMDHDKERTFQSHNFIRRETRVNAAHPERTFTVDIGGTCPRCGGDMPLFEHGKPIHCPHCNLRCTEWGAALDCEDMEGW